MYQVHQKHHKIVVKEIEEHFSTGSTWNVFKYFDCVT